MKWMQFIKRTTSMDFDEASAYISDHPQEEMTILDVRQPSEYESGHIPGATLIPLPELLERHSELDPEKPVLVY